MALKTYADLQTAMTTWLGNSLFSTNYPDLITLAEAYFNRKLRVRQMETTLELTTDANGNAQLPADFLIARRVTFIGSFRAELEYVHPSAAIEMYPTLPLPPSDPQIYTIQNTTLTITPPTTGSTIELDYYQKIPSLGTGMIGTLGTITGGTLYTNGTYTQVPLTGGAGSGAQATVYILGNAVTQVFITAPGTGYLVNDSLSASNANIGGTGSGFSVPVSTISTNWLFTAHPDLYLWASLAEAEMLGVNDQRFPLWKARRDELIGEIVQVSNLSKGQGGSRVMILGNTP